MTKELQEMLRLWSIQQVSDGQVSDVYVTLGNQFNTTVTAFQYYNVDLRCASSRTQETIWLTREDRTVTSTPCRLNYEQCSKIV